MEEKRKRRKFRKILLIAVLLAAAAVYGTASRSSEQDISVSLGEDSQEEVSTERKEGETAERTGKGNGDLCGCRRGCGSSRRGKCRGRFPCI